MDNSGLIYLGTATGILTGPEIFSIKNFNLSDTLDILGHLIVSTDALLLLRIWLDFSELPIYMLFAFDLSLVLLCINEPFLFSKKLAMIPISLECSKGLTTQFSVIM